MTTLKNIIFVIGIAVLCSCSDYLDVVPDNTPTLDHIFSDRSNAESFLFTCYNSMPGNEDVTSNPAFFAGGEAVCPLGSGYLWHSSDWSDLVVPAFRILSGEQNTNSPHNNYWDGERNGKNLFIGTRWRN